MNSPVTSSDITLLNTLAACANMTADEVFKDFEIMANKKILENHKYEIYYSESEKAGVPTYQMTPNPTTAVRLRGRVKRTLKKKSSDFILRSKKSKIVRIPHWKSYIQNGSYTKEITLL